MAQRPDWQTTVTRGVVKAERKRRRPVLAFNVDLELRVLLGAAAQCRGLSASAYARRAICAFIAHDLGLDYAMVTRFCPSVQDPENLAAKQAMGAAARTKSGGTINRGAVEHTSDDGLGYGCWEVCDDGGG
jgi:hypothetical protein